MLVRHPPPPLQIVEGCVCVRVECVRACVRVCVCACVIVCVYVFDHARLDLTVNLVQSWFVKYSCFIRQK